MNDHNSNDKASGTLKRLKATKLPSGQTSLWVIHRTLREGKAIYRVSRVNIDASLEKKLQSILNSEINRANQLQKYEFETGDQDEVVLFRAIDGTDFSEIAAQVLLGTNAAVINTFEELSGAWATLIVSGDNLKSPVFGFRRAPEGWNLKKLGGFYNAVFSNQKLISLDDQMVLRVDQRVDFIGFEDQLFILSKKAFEQGLNFRKGMETRRDTLVSEMSSSGAFGNVNALAEKCGSNMHYLRKFATIHQTGYYKDPSFMAKLQEANKREGWGLLFQDGKLLISDETIEVILTVLSNRRVQSMINEEKFDVDGAIKPLNVNSIKTA